MSAPAAEDAGTADRGALSDEAITREAGRIGGATMLSRVLGLVRDMQFAALFGTSRVADAFNLAFLLPNTLRLALAEGAVRSAVVPVVSNVVATEGAARGRAVAARTLTFWTLLLVLVSVLGVLLAAPMVRLYAPGWRDDPATLDLAIRLTRFLFPFILFAGLGALVGGVLNTWHRYAVPAFSPVAFNLLSIAAAFILCPRMGPMSNAVWGFAIGTMLGGLAGLVVQLPGLRSLRIGFSRSTGWKDPAVRRIGILLLPVVIGNAVFQVNTLVDTLLATRLGEGAVTALRLSQRVAMLPLGVFGIAVNTAALPSLSALAAARDLGGLRSTLGFSLRVTFAIMAPTCLGLVFLATPIVRVLFERGAFTGEESTAITASALLYLALGLPAFAAVKGLAQAFYAFHDTKTPFGVGIVAMIANLGLNLVLMGPLGVGGLALATSLSGVLNMVLLAVLLRRKSGAFRWSAVPLPVLRILALSVVSCAVAVLVHRALWRGGGGGDAEIIPVGAAVLAAGITYAALGALTRTSEVTVLWESHLARSRRRD